MDQNRAFQEIQHEARDLRTRHPEWGSVMLVSVLTARFEHYPKLKKAIELATKGTKT